MPESFISLYLDEPGLTSLYRYQQLRERLNSLDQLRQQRHRRLEQLQYLQQLVKPFQNPQENVQPNLITRDGELAQELEKMRMLVARVGGRVAQQKPKKSTQEEDYLLPGSAQRLDALLDTDV